MKHWFFLLLAFTSATSGYRLVAQSDVSMTTHWYNRASYNPAFIARTDYLYAFSNARYQWAGVSGAPVVGNFQVSDYIHNLRSAFGVSMVCDQLGVTRTLNPMAAYAWRFENKDNWSLALGLSLGMLNRTLSGDRFEAEVVTDPYIDYTIQRITEPDADAGIEFQNAHFIFGLSSTHLLSLSTGGSSARTSNHRYGYAIYKNNNLSLLYYKLELLVANRQNLTYVEGNVTVRFKHPTGLMKGPLELFDLGLTLRSTRQMTLLLGMMISQNLRVGYAFDQSFMGSYEKNSTHEIMVEYRIFNKQASTRLKCGKDLFWYH
jgi:type IX secretion system PorP/SprF family membrane protein